MNKDTVCILLTSVFGDYMKETIKCFKNNEDERNIRVVGCDIKPFNEFDVNYFNLDSFYQVPKCDCQFYVNELLDICKKEKVDFLIPCNTKELNSISQRRSEFEAVGTKVIISNYSGLIIANDKVSLYDYMKKNGYGVPLQLCSHSLSLIVKFLEMHPHTKFCYKERNSCGGRGFGVLNRLEDIRYLIKDNKGMFLQKYLSGKEYSVDLLVDNGKVLYSVVKLNLVMENGVAQKSIVINDDRISKECVRLCEELNLNGCIGFDLKEDENGSPFIIDCNPRLTATVSLCRKAGVNLPYLSLKKELGYNVYKDLSIKYGTSVTRKIVDFFTDESGAVIE